MNWRADLKNVRVSKVVPFEKTEHPAAIEPCVLDNVTVDFLVPLVFFYRPEKGESDAYKLGESLKLSLSKVLVPYYPFAGRWVRTYDARLRELICTDEGVPFIEADVDEEMLSVVNLEDFSISPWLAGFELLGFDSTAFCQDVDFPIPSFFVQMTRFKCGGIALHTTWAHQTADARGIFMFLKSWSEMALDGKTSIAPSHDRFQFRPYLQSVGSGAMSDQTFDGEEGKLKESKVDPGARLKPPKEALRPTLFKMLHVKREAIEQLKAEATANGMELSTGDLITAHVWRCSANPDKSLENRGPTRVNMAVDCRQKFHSPIVSDNYTGNGLLHLKLPVLSSSELSSRSHLSLAGVVRKGVRAFHSRPWASAFQALYSATDDEMGQGLLLMTTSWFRFPVYDITFGCGYGKPVLGCTNYSLGMFPGNALLTIYPPSPLLSRDVAATVTMLYTVLEEGSSDQADAFSSDDFFSFFR